MPFAKKKNPNRVSEQELAYGVLRAEGLTQKQAAKVLGISRTTAWQRDKNLDIYEQRKDKLLTKATRSVERLIEAKPFGSIDKVKDSVALQASLAVWDREKPKVQLSQSINVNLDFLPIELNDYR